MTRVTVFPVVLFGMGMLLSAIWLMVSMARRRRPSGHSSAGGWMFLGLMTFLFVGLPFLLVTSYRAASHVRPGMRPLREALRRSIESAVSAHAPAVAVINPVPAEIQLDETPASEKIAAAPAPVWVGKGTHRSSEGREFTEVVSGRHATEQDSLSDALHRAAAVAREALQREVQPRQVRWSVPLREIQARFVQEQYVAQVDLEKEGIDWPYGPMYQAHLLIDLNSKNVATLKETWEKEVLSRRLSILGSSLAFVLITLGTVAGYLRLDEATRGYYSGRLKLAAVTVVGGSGAALVSLLT